MDIDRYIVGHQAAWEDLEGLTARARRDFTGLSADELDRLVQRYQQTSANLSYVRTNFRDEALTRRLTRLVAAASGVLYGRRPRTLKVVGRFFSITFPAAAYHCRRFMWVATLVFVVPAVAVAVWMLNDPAAMDASGTPQERRVYVEEQFEQYYSEQPSAQFFTQVTTNNIRVGFLAFAAGGLLVLPGALVLGVNGLLLGQAAAWMISEGDALRFWGLILPHGALELTAIVMAGGAGLAVGWAAIAPGDRTRVDAVAEEGRRAAVIALGLMATFVAAGLIEGFVTGSGLPAGLRVAIGLTGWLAYLTYLTVQGRAAAAAGFTGAFGEHDHRRAPAAASV